MLEVQTREPLIRLNDVAVHYGAEIAGLEATTIEFYGTEFTVLLGPSGAGKSTLLRAINHLAEPTLGEVLVAGLGNLSDRHGLRLHRQRTAMIFQQHQLLSRYSAFRNVLIGRLGHHSGLRTLFPLPEADQRLALSCLERVGLLDKALERCDRLSGGQQQRAGIARALAQQPSLILADEPVASLDPATAEHVLSVLRDICVEEKIPCIVSLHQLELAKQFADRVVGLSHGHVLFDGSPTELTPETLERICNQQPNPIGWKRPKGRFLGSIP